MDKTNKRERSFLDLYGADFGRWPGKPSLKEQKMMQASPDYAAAALVDQALDRIAFPDMADDLFAKTMLQIKQTPPAPARTMVWVVLRRQAVTLGCMALMLGAGLFSGTYWNAAAQNSAADYTYYAMGPVAYNYALAQ